MNRSTVCAMKLARLAAVGVSLWFVAGCPSSSVNESKTFLANGNKYYGQKQWESAIVEYDKAIERYHDNHLAWYGKGGAFLQKHDYEKASDALQTAVQLAPEQPMYQMFYGVSLYERAAQKAREDQARKENKKPDEVTINPAILKLDAARDALRRAAKLAPDLWRAHYYLGRVYRDLDDARHAAEQFSLTIKTYPAYRFGYTALIDLYRRWDYFDQAITVALLGTANVPAAEAPELWFEAGMAYDAKHADDQAIDAFTKALAGKPDDASSKFQRGQIYVRKGDLDQAKRDLEDVVASADPQIASLKPIATQLLKQMASKKH
jgi:tetratricopeptide (TPR) repeat protein